MNDNAAELDALRAQVAEWKSTHQENSMARRMRAAIVEARKRLAKARFMWNGPCHECDAVLEQALTADCPVREDAEATIAAQAKRIAELEARFEQDAEMWRCCEDFSHTEGETRQRLSELRVLLARFAETWRAEDGCECEECAARRRVDELISATEGEAPQS